MNTELTRDRRIVQAIASLYDEWAGGGSLVSGPVDRLAKSNRFAFLVGVLLDEQMRYEGAWRGMVNLKQRLAREGVPFTPADIASLHLGTLKRLAKEKPAIHRFPNKMAERIKKAAQHIVDAYGGDPDAVLDTHTARELYFRLKEFDGISDKKANMAILLLIDELGYDYADRHHINVPVDRHVTRVFRRTGLVPPSGGREAIQRKAVELLPAAPWKLDGTFSIGDNWCTSEEALCNGYPEGNDYDALPPCPLAGVCRRVGVT